MNNDAVAEFTNPDSMAIREGRERVYLFDAIYWVATSLVNLHEFR